MFFAKLWKNIGHNNLKIEDKLELENYLIDLGYFFNRQDPVSYLAIKN